VTGGKKGEALRQGKAVQVDGHHAGEEVVVAAERPGSEGVHEYMPNTQIFHIMMWAYG